MASHNGKPKPATINHFTGKPIIKPIGKPINKKDKSNSFLPYKSPKNTCNLSDITDTLCLTGIADTTIEYAKSML